MQGLIWRLILNTAALWLLTQLYGGVFFASGSQLVDYLVAGLILGVVNAFIRPVLLLFTLPINFLTLGLFTLVINAAVLLLVSGLTNLEVRTFGAAFLGAIILSVISYALSMVFGSPERERRR
ncbi:MAG: phage holin family protein [Meiothermus sp.]|nr:phage holin family protein [Meiothermus sp.]